MSSSFEEGWDRVERAIKSTLHLAILLALIALPAWFVWADRGPFRWVADRNRLPDGSFPASFTVAMTFLIAVGAATALLAVLGAVLGKGATSLMDPLIRLVTFAPVWGDSSPIGSLMGFFAVLIFWVAGVVGAGLAVDQAQRSAVASVTAASLEAGQRPAARWIEVSGELQPEVGVEETHLELTGPEGRSRKSLFYYAAISSGGQSGKGAAVFLKFSENDRAAVSPAVPAQRFRGKVSKVRMSAKAKSAALAAGTPARADAIVISASAPPVTWGDMAPPSRQMAVCVLLVGLGLWFLTELSD